MRVSVSYCYTCSKLNVPMCKALYPYDPQEVDELTIAESDLIELVNEGKCVLLLYLFEVEGSDV